MAKPAEERVVGVALGVALGVDNDTCSNLVGVYVVGHVLYNGEGYFQYLEAYEACLLL